jgi:hypothetical protein
MIAVMEVPFGSRSIPSTASCLEDERAGTFADTVLVTATSDVLGFNWVKPLVVTAPFALRDDLWAGFADLDRDLLVAIWLSPV